MPGPDGAPGPTNLVGPGGGAKKANHWRSVATKRQQRIKRLELILAPNLFSSYPYSL